MKAGSSLSVAFLGIVSLAHLARVIFGLEIQIGDFHVPQWMSLAAFLFCGALSLRLYRECRGK